MSITNKQKLLLTFLLAITIILFTTYYKYPWHPDHYSLGQYSYALIEKGYAPWVLHPISLFGYYPLSTPAGFEFFFSVLFNISSLDLPILFYLFSIFFALIAVAAVYLLMREFTSFEASFLTAIVLPTMTLFAKNLSNTASSRMFNITFYPLFILILFKIFKIYKEEKRISFKYIITGILLFTFMNLIHRFGQLLLIFIISFFLALILVNFNGIIKWIKSKKIYAYRKKFYDYSVLLAYIDMEVIAFILFSFFFFKVILIQIWFVSMALIHYVWYDYGKVMKKKRSENLLLLDIFLFASYLVLAKALDIIVRGRFLINFNRLIEEYLFQLIILVSLFGLLSIFSIYIIYKKFNGIRNFLAFVKKKTFEILSGNPEKLISWALLLIFLFLFSRNFTGDNFYRFGLEHYTKSYFLEGISPWVIMINFILNLNNNVTILIYFAMIGAVYLFLKENKTFYDYFFVFVALGFSQFLLDWEYIRLYILPIYAIFVGIGLVFVIEKLLKKFGKKTIFAVLILLFVVHFAIGNVFIQREKFLADLDPVNYREIPEEYYMAAGNYLNDKGDISIHTSSSIDYDRKTAYYAKKVISVLAQSTFISNKNFEIEKISFSELWDSFVKGKKIRIIYSLKDPIFSSYYYHGRHISYLNGRDIYDGTVNEIIDLYNINYVIDSPDSTRKTKFFQSAQPIRNKVYSSSRLDVYDLSKGR